MQNLNSFQDCVLLFLQWAKSKDPFLDIKEGYLTQMDIMFNLVIILMPNIAYTRYCEERFRKEYHSNLQVPSHAQWSMAWLFDESDALSKWPLFKTLLYTRCLRTNIWNTDLKLRFPSSFATDNGQAPKIPAHSENKHISNRWKTAVVIFVPLTFLVLFSLKIHVKVWRHSIFFSLHHQT